MKLASLAFAACLAAAATTADAATHRPVPHHAAPAQPAGIMLACEGTAARIVAGGMMGTDRNEYSIAFHVRATPGSPEVAIMGVGGTRILKPGRYVASFHGGSVTLTMPWIDSNNHPQTLTLTIDPRGDFSGETVESMPDAANALCGLLGDSCGLMRVAIRIEMSGTCWGK